MADGCPRCGITNTHTHCTNCAVRDPTWPWDHQDWCPRFVENTTLAAVNAVKRRLENSNSITPDGRSVMVPIPAVQILLELVADQAASEEAEVDRHDAVNRERRLASIHVPTDFNPGGDGYPRDRDPISGRVVR